MISLLSLVAVLSLEQLRPPVGRRYIQVLLARYANYMERQLNAGSAQHGMVAWFLAVAPLVLLSAAIYIALVRAAPAFPIAALVWNVVVLYFCIGFRGFSRYFNDIRDAIRRGEIELARGHLMQWRGRSAEGYQVNEIVRASIEEGVVASHHSVLGVLVWFALLPGPSGAVLYRLACFLRTRWGERRGTDESAFGSFAVRAFDVLDWLPARWTALAFAVVGDFDDAIYCWRNQSDRWLRANDGIVLASAAGAIGVRLGMPLPEHGELKDRPELGLGEEADLSSMDSTTGLVWRAVVLWLLVLLLFSFGSWVGG